MHATLDIRIHTFNTKFLVAFVSTAKIQRASTPRAFEENRLLVAC